MKPLLVVAAMLGIVGIAAQAAGERASTPPGTAADGSAPQDGAIKGGAILPGESGGVPEARPGVTERAEARCYELRGTLREQCLRDARSAGAGGTRGPEAAPNVRDPFQPPPPQNPRQ